jgi:hypothetical protein
MWSSWVNKNWQRKPNYLEKSLPIASLLATNPTLSGRGSNPGCRGRKPATNCLICGAVHVNNVLRKNPLLQPFTALFLVFLCFFLIMWKYKANVVLITATISDHTLREEGTVPQIRTGRYAE